MPEHVNPYTGSKYFGTEDNIIPYLIKEIFEDGCYETGIESFDTVLDLGANIGVATDFFRARANKVIAVEPDNENFRNLQLFAQNGRFENVFCEKYAVSILDNQLVSLSKGHGATNRHVTWGNDFHHEISTADCPTITIASLLNKYELETVDLIKMDIEGSEVQVMTAPDFPDVTSRCSNWVIEIHNHEYQKLSELMRRLGFQNRVLSGFDLVNPVVHFYV